MPQSLSAMFIHVVFSTHQRKDIFQNPELRQRVHRYLGGITRNLDSPLYAVGGTTDHVHALIRLGKTVPIATLVKEIKRNSTLWIREQDEFNATGFSWQAGYGAFSVSESNVPAVSDYIARQEEHHRKWTFQDEFILLLKKHNIAFDEKHLW
ncbi:MAG: transposase [Deltaproteobacteria bacterium HGW-Deltaproteobacteria-22]|nr:MAG: transposase [Deltaproteobacteria bacterium HGW-Deltaproteobacteria-22]